MRFFFSILFFGLLPACVEAQSKKVNVPKKVRDNKSPEAVLSPYSLSFKAGLTQFFGELNEQDMKGSFGVGVGRKFGKSASVSLDYTVGEVGGQKVKLFNAYFLNEYNTIEVLGKWDLTAQFGKHKSNAFHLNLYGGVGLMSFSVKAYDLLTNRVVRFSNSEVSKRNQLFRRWGNPGGQPGIKKTREGIAPLGTSFDYIFSDRWKLGLDYRFYFVRTDKVDATSGQRLINPEEKDSYSETPNDKFSLLSVTLTHGFTQKGRR